MRSCHGFLLVWLALVVVACGGDGSNNGGSTIPPEGTDVAVGTPLSVVTHPPPGTPGGGVSVDNPCEVAVRVEYRLAPPGEEGEPPNVIRKIGAGKSVKLGGYLILGDRGPLEVVMMAPELGWTARQSAPTDGGTVHFSIDPETCPTGD